MKTFTLFAFFISIAFSSIAQTVDYSFTYDAAGNRTKRELISLKSLVNNSPDTTTAIYTSSLLDFEIKIYPNPTKKI